MPAAATRAGPAAVDTATAVARDVTSRVADPRVMAAAVSSEQTTSTFPPSVRWRPHTLASGWAGTAVLLGAADARWPGEGWDVAGHRHLTAATAALPQQARVDASLFSGLAGIGFAAITLAAGRDRYRRLLATVDDTVVPMVVSAVPRLDAGRGCDVGEFDLISGLTGTGVYLLARRSKPQAEAALHVLLGGLVRLLADRGEPRRWHTPAHLVGGPMRANFPRGNHNCGLAHGVPGPLALLAIAACEGVVVDGLSDAIECAAEWLVEHAVPTAHGPDWPNAVGVSPDGGRAGHLTATDRPTTDFGGRAAWCYGTPGVARALGLAGVAIDRADLRALAERALRGVLARSSAGRGLSSPTFCHGMAGTLQVTLRFAMETGLAEFQSGVDTLLAELLAAYEPESVLGFRNVEPGNIRVDAPGLLGGAPGVALALLAAGGMQDQSWDRLFLLA